MSGTNFTRRGFQASALGLAASAAGGMSLQGSGGFVTSGDQTFETWVFLPSLFDGTRAMFELSSSGGWVVSAGRTAPRGPHLPRPGSLA